MKTRSSVLPRRTAEQVTRANGAGLGAEAIETARGIVETVRREGESALRRFARTLDGLEASSPLVLRRGDLERTRATISGDDLARLERIADRIRCFAAAQRAAVAEVEVEVPGGRAGHRVVPVARAGCYAPGGRHPLPSSVLMTVVPARTAGVEQVWVASPKPTPHTIAAAAVAGADGLLAAGGAQAIAALAFGIGVPRVDVIVGPGNQYVTAAKKLLAGEIRIESLAGPSELVVLADDAADPGTVAADLLAQAEHDPDAFPLLVTPCERLVDEVEAAIRKQLTTLPTAETAAAALANGGAVRTIDIEEAAHLCNALAPEHLQVIVRQPDTVLPRLTDYGALFVGERSGEVFGDYGIGPNHVLPTGGTARSSGGLSVLDFLRFQTWVELSEDDGIDALIDDVSWLARAEGLEAHARAAEARRPSRVGKT